jgi:hypothetical protein
VGWVVVSEVDKSQVRQRRKKKKEEEMERQRRTWPLRAFFWCVVSTYVDEYVCLLCSICWSQVGYAVSVIGAVRAS